MNNSCRIPERVLGPDAIAGTAALTARVLPGPRLLALCDDQTWAAAGEKLKAQLPEIEVRSLGKRVRATKALAEELSATARDYDGLVAVGSGTINDLTKYASASADKPYLSIATAASMNGYSSANASLEVDGLKQSFPARPPLAVVADMGVLTQAPKRLTRAGIGDTLCRTTVEADSLISHHLLGTAYPRAMFDRLRAHEAALLPGLMGARENEAAYIATLMTALLDAGDAMTEFGSSAVASQGEHMIAHTLELKYGSELHNLLHGELIAVASLTMSQFQHRMLLMMPNVRAMPYDIEQFTRLFGKARAGELAAIYGKKLLGDEQSMRINMGVSRKWPEVAEALKEVMLPTNTLERAFVHSGISTQPTQIGLPEERYRFATSYAHMTRDRFTFLDLAAMNVKRMR